jgi:hypothetical protein
LALHALKINEFILIFWRSRGEKACSGSKFCDTVFMSRPSLRAPQHQDVLQFRRLPARLLPEATATLLGFEEHDIPVLIARKLLVPLGKPSSAAVKHFATAQIEQLAQDSVWLHKATAAIYDNWKHKNKRNPACEARTQDSGSTWGDG